ncbi:DUF3558 domain-containing protein [Rhodococcus sp. W8901]|uniref:DUF3558 domain-containing protein n=1 Tax=Rhodococcus sp. W8901 TaxID=2742603 RepID=UPI001581A7FB|nr:DUF3558 domain-containing protein [Rhodococcus sp. W8901]QKT09467.1 DUF3558 domain-containing protein [Rhodococcus sp. W8901]
MRSSNRHRAAICIAAGLLALTGCGTTSVGGQAETAQPPSGEPQFDPCSIPDDALRAAGVDPATQSRDIVGVKQPGWSLCRWRGPDYFVTVFAAGRPLDDILANDRFHDVTPVDVDGRSAFTVRESNDTRNEYCDVAFSSGPDAIMIKSTYFDGLPASDSPCPLAVRNGAALAPSIPH